MLRLLGFFVVAWILSRVLAVLPLVGPFFARTGILGVWVSAILLSWALTHYGSRAYRMRRDAAELRRLTAVDSPHNLGKAGTLLLAQGRNRRAIELLRRATQGEPDSAEWHWRLGSAYANRRLWEEARESLARCVAIDEEHAYGAPQLRLAEACLADGEPDAGLEAVARFERNHGPTPESAYRRGVIQKALGRKSEAASSLGEVAELAAQAVKYQRQSANAWVARAWWARLF